MVIRVQLMRQQQDVNQDACSKSRARFETIQRFVVTPLVRTKERNPTLTYDRNMRGNVQSDSRLETSQKYQPCERPETRRAIVTIDRM